MCRLAPFVAAAALALTACGATAAAAHTPIAFGVGGGNIVPFLVTIQPNGVVRHTASVRVRRVHLPETTVARLRLEVQRAHLVSRRCAGTLPDVGSQLIRVGSRTWTVHGGCEQRFERVWSDLGRAVGLGPA